MQKIISGLLLLIVSAFAYADIRLPRIFSDHMVLQRNKPIHIWGWAAPGEAVKVSLGTATQSTKAGKQGKWEVSLPQMSAGGPYTLSVSGKNKIQLNDVLIGEVWLCGGQSNMEWPLRSATNAQQEIAQADYSMIRQIKIPHATELQPQDDVKGGEWEVCSPATAANFTAVGYFYARELYKELNVPIGLINSNWGGTMVETWISNASFFENPEFAGLKKNMPANLDSIARVQQLAMDNLIKNAQGALPSAAEASSFSLGLYNDNDWKSMKLPSMWENAGLPNLDGIVWFRKQIEIPAGSDLSKGIISLGPIDDIDSTFINGAFIGNTNAYNTDRFYQLPEGLLKEGNNMIAIKVIDGGGGGGVYGKTEQMKLQTTGLTIPLSGNWKYRIAQHQPVSAVSPNDYPTLLYNAMIHPLTPYPIAGAIWYQGETNAGRSMQYKTAFPLMIKDWRKQWKEEFPFYFVQLANFRAGSGNNSNEGSGWAELREAQTDALKLPNTGMAVIIDIGESNDIHPRNKQDVGKRLAANALAKTYGKNAVYSGPVFQSMQVQGNKALLSFSNVEGGFDVKNKYGYVNGFEVAGADQRFYYAKAMVEGDKIAVYHEAVAVPVAVRYAWADDPDDVNLYNKAGFPAAPFRTDQWKAKTAGVRYQIR
ncbi:MAG: sialate O-acetylesterase [Chitinophagaceae bacterium]